MHINRGVKKRKRLSLTPLIDVIFLLLLFFMLSSTFTRFSEVEIKSGSNSSGAVSTPDALLIVTAENTVLNGLAVTLQQLPTRLSELKKLGAKTLVIAVSQEVSSQKFVNILHTASNGPLTVSVARK